jgi:gluconate 2-dehydrogenase gamma chain
MHNDAPEVDGLSRREFVARLSALSAVWLAASACARETPPATPVAQVPTPVASVAPTAPPKLVHFSPADAHEVEAIAARILPSDDGPGATEAGAVYFIDNTLTTFAKDQAPLFASGLAALAKSVKAAHGPSATFSSLAAADQDAALRAIEKTEFFGAMRFATLAGFLSLPKYGGNRDFVGWKYIGQQNVMEQHPPFGWYDRPENQQALLGRVLS